MASYLGYYPGAASNREEKFHRAINSYLSQSHKDKELIVVSDGCEITSKIIKEDYPEIKLREIERKGLFSGRPRNEGIKFANGDIICYLDSDDLIGSNHLQAIADQFGGNDFVYYNDYVVTPEGIKYRDVQLKRASIGTSSWAHKRDLGVKWRDGYNHDWHTISEHINRYDRGRMGTRVKYTKIKDCQYFVHHIPQLIDL